MINQPTTVKPEEAAKVSLCFVPLLTTLCPMSGYYILVLREGNSLCVQTSFIYNKLNQGPEIGTLRAEFPLLGITGKRSVTNHS